MERRDQFARAGESLAEAGDGIDPLLRIESQPLAHFQRSGGVIQSQEEQAIHISQCRVPNGECQMKYNIR